MERLMMMMADLMVGKGKAVSTVTEGSTQKGQSSDNVEDLNEKEEGEGELIPSKMGGSQQV